MFTSCKRNIGAAVRTFIVWIWANFLFFTECFYTMHVQLLGSFKTTVTVLELEESGSPHWICICFLFNAEKNFTSKLGQTVGQPANTYNDDNSSHDAMINRFVFWPPKPCRSPTNRDLSGNNVANTLFNKWSNILPPGKYHISHLGKRKVIDSKVPW